MFRMKKSKKRPNEVYPAETLAKKPKLNKGFIVESCERVTPSKANEKTFDVNYILPPRHSKVKKTYENNTKSKNIPKLGENMNESKTDLTPEDMLTWAEFKLPDEIVKGLAELGFKKPTKIQELTLPAAIHGRRDILGAAETGSGKTLAFGLPILSGIMTLKEKASARFDVYKFRQITDSDDSQDEIVLPFGTKEFTDEGLGCVKVIDDIEIPGQMVTKTGKPLYALILTPTRELAIQISRHLIAVAKYTGVKVATIVGGMAAVKQERVLRSSPEVVVATPGRLWELITQGEPHLQQLDSVKFLAIDETDRMVERNHFEELQPLLERLNVDEIHKTSRQNFVFSATLTMVHELPTHMRRKKVTKRGKIINRKIHKMTPQQKIKRLIDMIGITDPKVVDITKQNLGTAETLTECRITCSLDHKDSYLYYILKRHPGRTMVFCNSIGCVKRLAQLFILLECRPLPLHASMPQRQRLKNLERFRDDPHGVLVSTDVAARGLDIPNVDHVIHYQVPRTAENYVHRSGRTARATKEGLTILMMEPSEAYLYSKLCRTLNKTVELPTFPVPFSSLASVKEIVSAARDLDSLMLKRKRGAQAQGWREKAAREMDIIIDEDDVPVKEIDPALEKAVQVKKKQLQSMLTRPLFPRGFSFKYPTLNKYSNMGPQENALQAMKKVLESGDVKKEKRKSKNSSLLQLERVFA